MNKILTILVIAILTMSCKKDHPDPKPITYTPEYNVGDVIYIKPDSLKVVIQDFDEIDNTYKVYWRVADEYSHVWVDKSMIYGTVVAKETEITGILVE
jgi:hypothetical protein